MQTKNIIWILIAVVAVVAIVWVFSAQPDTLGEDSQTINEDPAGLTQDPSETGEDSMMEKEGNGHMVEKEGPAMEDDTPESDSPVVAHTISYTNDGFSPATLTINSGDTVTFINNSSRDFWPASAMHPTHRVYPEKTAGDCAGSAFDACARIASGESWPFTFNEVGTWKYHDHLNPNHTGSITVE